MFQGSNNPFAGIFNFIIVIGFVLLLIILILSVLCVKSCNSHTHTYEYKQPLKGEMLIKNKNGILDTTYTYNIK